MGRLFYPCTPEAKAPGGRWQPKRGSPWMSTFHEATGARPRFPLKSHSPLHANTCQMLRRANALRACNCLVAEAVHAVHWLARTDPSLTYNSAHSQHRSRLSVFRRQATAALCSLRPCRGSRRCCGSCCAWRCGWSASRSACRCSGCAHLNIFGCHFQQTGLSLRKEIERWVCLTNQANHANQTPARNHRIPT